MEGIVVIWHSDHLLIIVIEWDRDIVVSEDAAEGERLIVEYNVQ